MTKPIICYPLLVKGSRWNCNELRYSLRSLERYWYQDGEPQVYILTEKDRAPKWLRNVEIVDAKGYCEAMKEAVRLAKERSETGEYVWMNDDIFFLKPTSPNHLDPWRLQAKSLGDPYAEWIPDNSWTAKLHRMRDKLADFGMSDHNFCTHSPYLFHWEKMEMTWGRFGLNYKIPVETAYGNMWRVETQHPKDRICFFNQKEVPKQVDGLRFLNISEKGMSGELRAWIQGLFPHRSKYEAKD